ncbi:malonate decarboxylase subunit epsilon [Acerihabitans sp. TG2]|uniref:malonate decarboxylase subunit epsilon n=1 Tax=Acerihabitans sp. TG2 TaxID=3096008 RepID=UPI002B232B4C|nr:malonate decarboxylase subunit epsilon [Acerihabitans sp. TG2]MEA9390914.1 malonate decarboxylase subunit epsilon [Acerihabitans sp. TG2]
MKLMLTFPGQGPQVPGMLHHLPVSDDARALLAQATTVLGAPVDELDSAEALQSTRAVQLCLFIAGVVYARQVLHAGIAVDMVSGLSIGAFPAAVCAGALSYADGVRLVALRGELMQQAYPEGYGLSAIAGLSRTQVENLIARIHSPALPVYLANLNAEDQFVIAGSVEAMTAVCHLASEQGASRTQRLAVSVPSHCELLAGPADQLAQAMAKVTLQRPEIAYLSGSTGRVIWQPERIAEDLARNMARPVHWQDAMVSAYERDVRLAIEMPPGTVLTGLTKRVMAQGEALALSQHPLSLINTLAGRLMRD